MEILGTCGCDVIRRAGGEGAGCRMAGRDAGSPPGAAPTRSKPFQGARQDVARDVASLNGQLEVLKEIIGTGKAE